MEKPILLGKWFSVIHFGCISFIHSPKTRFARVVSGWSQVLVSYIDLLP